MRTVLRSLAAACCPLFGLLAALPALAQSKTPRTAEGRTDFSGVLQGGGVSLYGVVSGNTRATEAVAKKTPPAQTSGVRPSLSLTSSFAPCFTRYSS